MLLDAYKVLGDFFFRADILYYSFIIVFLFFLIAAFFQTKENIDLSIDQHWLFTISCDVNRTEKT